MTDENSWQVAPYRLNFADSSANGVEGVLLRSENSQGIGYTSLQPWPQFGDLALGEQLKKLKVGESTSVLRQSLQALELDREARAAGRSLLRRCEIPESHFLLRAEREAENLPLLKACGFQQVKCKFLPSEELLERYEVNWRIDPNSSLDEATVLSWWKDLSWMAKERVEFIEDPCPYDHALYQRLAETLPLAIDWHGPVWSENPFAVKALVLKPAAVDALSFAEEFTAHTEKFVVTSAMDHPLGQCYAALIASRLKEEFFKKTAICGLNSHTVFTATDFTRDWQELSPKFLPPEGTGLGFDHLLADLPWQEL